MVGALLRQTPRQVRGNGGVTCRNLTLFSGVGSTRPKGRVRIETNHRNNANDIAKQEAPVRKGG